jgi:hypothetical protein
MMNAEPNSPFPWPNREVGGRRLAWVMISVFAAIALTIGAEINNAMLDSTEDSTKNSLIVLVLVGLLFGVEMWFTVIRRYRRAFTILKFAAYAVLVASFAFDLYFFWNAYELGPNFSWFGNATNVNPPAETIFTSVSANIASLIALYFGIKNEWFYAAADNDSWD